MDNIKKALQALISQEVRINFDEENNSIKIHPFISQQNK